MPTTTTKPNLNGSAKAKATAASVADPATMMVIPELPQMRVNIPIVGTTPLIVHRWDEKIRKQMLDGFQKKAVVKARLGRAWLGAARQGRRGTARRGSAGQGLVWQGKAGRARNLRRRPPG